MMIEHWTPHSCWPTRNLVWSLTRNFINTHTVCDHKSDYLMACMGNSAWPIYLHVNPLSTEFFLGRRSPRPELILWKYKYCHICSTIGYHAPVTHSTPTDPIWYVTPTSWTFTRWGLQRCGTPPGCHGNHKYEIITHFLRHWNEKCSVGPRK